PARWPEVGAGGIGCIVAVTGGRGAWSEIPGLGEVLPYQSRADDDTVANNQAAIGGRGEDRLTDAGDRKRIEKPREDRKQHDHDDGATDGFGHEKFLRRDRAWRRSDR